MKLLTPKQIQELKEREAQKRSQLLSSLKTIDVDLDNKKLQADNEFKTYYARLEREFFDRREELKLECAKLTNDCERLRKDRKELAGPLFKEQAELDKARHWFEVEKRKFESVRDEIDEKAKKVSLKLEYINSVKDEINKKYDDIVIRERRLLEREKQLDGAQTEMSHQRAEVESKHRVEVDMLKRLQEAAQNAKVEADAIREAYQRAITKN